MNCFTPLKAAVMQLLLATVLLCSAQTPALAANPSEELIPAIITGDEEKAILLLQQGADPNVRAETKLPALWLAAYLGREKTLAAMLTIGADLRAAPVDGGTALHLAALGGQAGSGRLLLARGLSVNDRSGTDGMTPLFFAAARGNLKVMRLLLDWQADVNILDSGGNTALLHAAMRGRADAVRLLLKHGAKVNTPSSHGWTPLMAAAWEGHTSVVKDLLKRGANANLVNSEHRSALMLAESEGHQAVVRLLKPVSYTRNDPGSRRFR
jgi:uncharacterized protein